MALKYEGKRLPTLAEIVEEFGLNRGVHSSFNGFSMPPEKFADFEKEYTVIMQEKIQQRVLCPSKSYKPLSDVMHKVACELLCFNDAPQPSCSLEESGPPPSKKIKSTCDSFARRDVNAIRRPRFDCMVTFIEFNKFEGHQAGPL